ncbi:MAG TPA: DotD/TraH family lipoprotein [Alphaproteobacteria bacterium]
MTIPHVTLPALLTRTSLVCATLMLSACSGNGYPKPQLVAEPDPIVARLAAAADRAANALDTLASVENTRTPVEVPPLAAADGTPIELRRAITVDWVGPVEPLAEQLADRASYRFQLSGQKPSVPMVVVLRVRNEPLIDVLRDLGLQLNNRATLRVDPSTQTIEIVYGPNTPAPFSQSNDTMDSMITSLVSPGAAVPVEDISAEDLATPTFEEADQNDNPLASPF